MLSLAAQDSDNPDLRDRGYICWRLLSTDPAAVKEVVLADKPLIADETDLEPTLLDGEHYQDIFTIHSKCLEGEKFINHRFLPTKFYFLDNIIYLEA